MHEDSLSGPTLDRERAAGADINALTSLTPTPGREHARAGQAVLGLIEQLATPVIAASNGRALGGGCEPAGACTMRIAADPARLGQPEINLGMIPGFGGEQRLSRLVGAGRALELRLTGEPIGAAQAHRRLVNHVVPDSELMVASQRMAAAVAAEAPVSVCGMRDAVRGGVQLPLGDAQALGATLFGLVASTPDMPEGARAFLEQRAPEFKGT